MLPDVSLFNFPRPAEVPVRGGSLGHGGDGQDGDSGVPRCPPVPPGPGRAGPSLPQLGGAGAAPGAAPGLGQRSPRGRGGAGGHRDRARLGHRVPRGAQGAPTRIQLRWGLGPLPPGQDGASWPRCASREGGGPGPDPRAPFLFLLLLDFPEPRLPRAPSPGLLNFSPRQPQRSLLSSTRSLFSLFIYLFSPNSGSPSLMAGVEKHV